MSFVYQLPWRSDGTGGSIVRAIINDWQVNGIFQAFSGIALHGHRRRHGAQHARQHADSGLVGPSRRSVRSAPTGVLDPAAWAQPEGVRFGTTPLNQFRGPGGWNLDFSLFRGFPIAGRQRLEVRVEAVQHDQHAEVRATRRATSPAATSCASSV